ncbi:hypothetical protein KIN20_030796 [Parelaphostrongylus tenuis]|uniref:BTB domain-containing protein n=1 Tax=Parelaphostrongylus tenuis TaxID=148309 RepID=A0AAD5R484_PARTN|nr:hypothetical protein KIN20_030796 [Parelaphostrongylus tenuis]
MATKPDDESCDTSPQFTRVFDPNEKSARDHDHTRLSNWPLVPASVRKTNGTTVSHKEMCNNLATHTTAFMQQQMRVLEKLERLERLSQDMSRLIEEESLTDVRIQCIDGCVNAHRCLLHSRTSLMSKASQTDGQSVEINENKKVVRHWLQYVYSGRVEWEKDDAEKIQKIAEQYGPERSAFTVYTDAETVTFGCFNISGVLTTKPPASTDYCDFNRGVSPCATEPVNQPAPVSQVNVDQQSSLSVVIPDELTIKLAPPLRSG